MALHKGLLNEDPDRRQWLGTWKGKLPKGKKHFHDHDETWIILKGKGTSYWIDPAGSGVEFLLEEGDVWMIPVGYEHVHILGSGLHVGI